MAVWMLILLTAIAFNADDVGGSATGGAPMHGDFVPLHCWNFTVGDAKRHEFYSPRYPHNYANNSECMQLLAAPKGYRIRLDFRDDFHIEESQDCKYDFLELRDGPFGYSPLIGTYCGRRHPPLTESSSRFLWVRFKSDDTIEYRGFRAVYHFYKPLEEDGSNDTDSLGLEPDGPSLAYYSDEVCHVEADVTRGDGLLDPSHVPDRFLKHSNLTGATIDCTFVFYLPPQTRVYLRWELYDMSTPERCDDSFLELYDRTTAANDRKKQYCGGLAKDYRSVSNHVYLRMYARNFFLIPRFRALYTVFVKGPCPDHMYSCGDNTCIDSSLVCNKHVNCRIGWDEKGCVKPTTEATQIKKVMVSYHSVVLGCVSGVIITVVLVAICITCQQRRKEELRRQQALKHVDDRAEVEIELLGRPSTSQDNRRQIRDNPVPNHVVANHVTPTANHVPPGGGPRPITNRVQHNGNGGLPYITHRSEQQRAPAGHDRRHVDENDVRNPQPADDVTYKRYLNVTPYPDDDSSTGQSVQEPISVVATVERPSGSPRPPANQDRDNHVTAEGQASTLPRTAARSTFRSLSPPRMRPDPADTQAGEVWKPQQVAQAARLALKRAPLRAADEFPAPPPPLQEALEPSGPRRSLIDRRDEHLHRSTSAPDRSPVRVKQTIDRIRYTTDVLGRHSRTPPSQGTPTRGPQTRPASRSPQRQDYRLGRLSWTDTEDEDHQGAPPLRQMSADRQVPEQRGRLQRQCSEDAQRSISEDRQAPEIYLSQDRQAPDLRLPARSPSERTVSFHPTTVEYQYTECYAESSTGSNPEDEVLGTRPSDRPQYAGQLRGRTQSPTRRGGNTPLKQQPQPKFATISKTTPNVKVYTEFEAAPGVVGLSTFRPEQSQPDGRHGNRRGTHIQHHPV